MKPRELTPLDEGLKAALRPAPAPADLRASLMAAAATQDRLGAGRGPSRLRRLMPGLAAAAMLTLALGGSFWAHRVHRPEAPAVAQDAIRNFMEIHALDFRGPAPLADGSVCPRWAEERLGFQAPLPGCCEAKEVQGGRVCSVAGRPVAHYLLSKGRGLYVFGKPIPGCASGLEPTPLASAGTLQARAWNEQGRGYVLVEPPQ